MEGIEDAFLERFSPPSRILQLKDEIYNSRKFSTEILYETWLRLNKKLKQVPNHIIPHDTLLEILYRSLNANNKAVPNTITRGEFMGNTYAEVAEMLDKVTNMNRP